MAATAVPTALPTGFDLKVARLRAGVTQRALARRIGIARPLVSRVEAEYRPTRHSVERYLAALEHLAAER